MTILEQVARPSVAFRPKTVREFLALQLARKLGDAENASKYVHALGLCSEELVLRSYHRTLGRSNGSMKPADHFFAELERLAQKEANGPFQAGRN